MSAINQLSDSLFNLFKCSSQGQWNRLRIIDSSKELAAFLGDTDEHNSFPLSVTRSVFGSQDEIVAGVDVDLSF